MEGMEVIKVRENENLRLWLVKADVQAAFRSVLWLQGTQSVLKVHG